MVPPVETTATGIANLTFDNSTSEFTWEISHSLPLSDVIGAHIREGEVGENGGIVIPPRPHREPHGRRGGAHRRAGRRSAARRHGVRRLVVRGSVDPRAAGERVVMRFRAAGRQIVIRPLVQENGHFAVNRRLRGPQRRAQGGQLRLRYQGNEVLRAVGERLRAARRAVGLRIARLQLQQNRLVVVGQVRPGARRQARIQVKSNRPNGDPAQVATRVRVNQRGRFSTRLRVHRRSATSAPGSRSRTPAAGDCLASGSVRTLGDRGVWL